MQMSLGGGGDPPHEQDGEFIKKVMQMASARGTIADLSAETNTEAPHRDAWTPSDFSDQSDAGRSGTPFPQTYGQQGRCGWYDHGDWIYSQATDRYEPPSGELNCTGYESLRFSLNSV